MRLAEGERPAPLLAFLPIISLIPLLSVRCIGQLQAATAAMEADGAGGENAPSEDPVGSPHNFLSFSFFLHIITNRNGGGSRSRQHSRKTAGGGGATARLFAGPRARPSQSAPPLRGFTVVT
jgi:hypothetical protein